MRRQERRRIPSGFPFYRVPAVPRSRPSALAGPPGNARPGLRIPGVTPAAVAVLSAYLWQAGLRSWTSRDADASSRIGCVGAPGRAGADVAPALAALETYFRLLATWNTEDQPDRLQPRRRRQRRWIGSHRATRGGTARPSARANADRRRDAAAARRRFPSRSPSRVRLFMVESKTRKSVFLREAVALGLKAPRSRRRGLRSCSRARSSTRRTTSDDPSGSRRAARALDSAGIRQAGRSDLAVSRPPLSTPTVLPAALVWERFAWTNPLVPAACDWKTRPASFHVEHGLD